jgi:hypothetical protein
MRRHVHALRRIVTSLVEEKLARRHKKGVYLIKRAEEAVVAVMTTDARLGQLPPSLNRRRCWGSSAQQSQRGWCTDDRRLYEGLLAAEGYGRGVVTK